MNAIKTDDAVRWTLTGGAFLSVLAIAGCSKILGPSWNSKTTTSGGDASVSSHEPVKQTVPAPSTDTLFATELDDEAQPPVVNVFGELDGIERPAGAGINEAGFQQHTFVTEGADADVSVDATGKYLVFTSTRHTDHPKIYLQKTDGLSVTQLTSDGSDDAHPTFSPDGKHVAFSSTRGGNWDLYLMGADGKNIVQLTHSPMHELHPSFSPDGSMLVYCALGGRSGQWEIWTIDLSTSETRMIGTGVFPTWSTEKGSGKIAFQRSRQRGSRWFSLWTLDLINGEARNVSEVAVSSNAAIISPAWSPDGKKLAFATIIEPAKGSRTKMEQDIWTINADGTGRSRLTDGIGSNLSPAWASDGRVYFISDRGGNECVWSVEAGSKQPSSVATTPQE